MRRKTSTVLLALVLALSVLGLLIGCNGNGNSNNGGNGNNGEQEEVSSDIVSIDAYPMKSGTINFTNYTVSLKYAPEEWNALSDAEKERIALSGFDSVTEKIKANSVSNYTISGMTAKTTDSAGTVTKPQMAFLLDLENSTLQVYLSSDASSTPTVISEIPVKLP
jgi:hypothetical protein